MTKKIKIAVYGAVEIAQALPKQLPLGSPTWNDYEFVINKECVSCDYLFVIDSVKDTIEVNCNPQNTYLCICEPKDVKIYSNAYIRQFGNLISFRSFNCFKGNVLLEIPMLPWRVGSKYNKKTHKLDFHDFLDYDFLSQKLNIPKLDKVAIITSNKTITKGQRRRLDFLLKLKEIIPEQLDIYGEGFQFVEDKWDIFSKYKYVFAFENCRVNGYVTEKIFDAYISEALPLYWGAPDISDYCSDNSYIVVDFHSVKKMSDKIVDIIRECEYERRLTAILSEKNKTLNYYNMFVRMAKIVESEDCLDINNKMRCVIRPERLTLAYKLKQKFCRVFS